MDVRQRTEEIEHLTFAPWATFSDASRGRAVSSIMCRACGWWTSWKKRAGAST